MERLQKVLAKAGIASRRQAEEMILQGRISVNGKPVSVLGSKVDPEKDKIQVDGKTLKSAENKVYVLLNKPQGYVTTVKDPQGRPKVTDLLKGIKERVYPVGRLDYDTEGLLLLTNDGELTYLLTHPKHGVEKTYLAQVVGLPSGDGLNRLRKGIKLADGTTAPAKAKRLAVIEGNALLEIKIHEGKNRQVRRMCESIGHPVMKLQRTEFGNLTLAGVALGHYRRLSPEEVSQLKKLGPSIGKPAHSNRETTPKTGGRADKASVAVSSGTYNSAVTKSDPNKSGLTKPGQTRPNSTKSSWTQDTSKNNTPGEKPKTYGSRKNSGSNGRHKQ